MSITDDGLGNITFTSTGSGGGLDKLNIIPTGLKDSFNTVFTLPTAPNPADSLMLFLNGAFQENGGVDYTLVGNVITFVNPPVLNSNIVAFYNDNGGSSGGTSFVQAFVIADWVLNGV